MSAITVISVDFCKRMSNMYNVPQAATLDFLGHLSRDLHGNGPQKVFAISKRPGVWCDKLVVNGL